MLKATTYANLTLQYVRPPRYPANASPANYALWMLLHPWKSRSGYRRLMARDTSPLPATWNADFAGRRVLVMGTGPSLDRAPEGFAADFDTVIHINFALRELRQEATSYFFTTDLVAVVPMIEKFGVAAFETLGRDRCIFAPVFFDQYPMLTEKGRELFTVLSADAASWRAQRVGLGPLALPLALRYHPQQPDWDRFHLPEPGLSQPVIDHTSALSAVLFAAIHGARDIGLIGCDFSAGRAASVSADQAGSDVNIFSGAAEEFRRIASALARTGTSVVNHSWTI
jgi:hypothetical protein